jgi:RimJ/RimL family protein N-acetyltransferase
MMQYVFAGRNNPEVHKAIEKWVSLHSFGHTENRWPESSSYGVLMNGEPIAGVIYHDYKPMFKTIQYSGAATDRRWLQGPSLHYMFGHMFETVGCQMVMTGNSSKNTGLHKILERLDHKKHVIERAWGRDDDMFLWTLTREQWLANPAFQRSRKRAEA